MKKCILTIVALFSLGFISFGQTFEAMSGDTATAAYPGPGEFECDNNIKNVSSNDIYIKWRVLSSSIPTGWNVTGVCDNVQCYTNNILSGGYQVSAAYAPNTPGVFHTNFKGDNAPNNSSAWVKVEVADTANHFTKNIVFVATKNSTGVVNVSRADDDVVLYPNPARSSLNVVFNGNSNVRNIIVYNLIGKAITAYKVVGNNAKLDIDSIPSGIYFIRLLDGQGRIVATRKFTHQ